MKKIVLMFASSFLLFGCQKDWTCECTVNNETVTYPIKDKSKRDAESICHEKMQTHNVYIPGSKCEIIN